MFFRRSILIFKKAITSFWAVVPKNMKDQILRMANELSNVFLPGLVAPLVLEI